MNTSQLKKFSQEARRSLMNGVTQRLNFWGYDKNGILTEEPMFVPGGVLIREEAYDEPGAEPKWKALQKAIREHGYKNVVEEAAYTWFNRLMAIRILAKNDFDTPQLEYGGDGMNTPLILRRARSGSMDFLDSKETENLKKVLTDYDKEYRAFSILITGYCKHHKLLSAVFGKINDYSDLLLPSNMLEETGFIHLVNTSGTISNEDYKSPELIGWLYQFYISEKKDEVFASFKKNKKAEAEDIPAATQIFTPNWIVKYMVQNTAGKIWLDEKPDSKLREKMKYLVETPQENWTEQEQEEKSNLIHGDPKNLKLLDPACGSGHILTEGFDLIYEMYMEDFYSPGEAVECILKNNLFGLDIDLRAAQLARFAVLLKAAAKDKSILNKGILPKVYSMPEKDQFDRSEVRQFLGTEGAKWENELFSALDIMQDARNIGSVMILNIPKEMLDFLKHRNLSVPKNDILLQAIFIKIKPFLDLLFILGEKYEAIAANPPFMGTGNMNSKLKAYVNKFYPTSKMDLFCVFMEVIPKLLNYCGKWGFITPPSWMFLSSFEKLRLIYLENYSLSSLLHLSRGIFGADFGSVTAVLCKTSSNYSRGNFFRLIDRTFQEFNHFQLKELFEKVLENNEYKFDFTKYEKEGLIPQISNIEGNKIYYSSIPQKNFSKIPGSPIAYWVSDKIMMIFSKSKPLIEIAEPRQGFATGQNELFLKFWHEVNFSNIEFECQNGSQSKNSSKKWYPCNKGGTFRKWYGNNYIIANWKNDGETMREFEGSVIRNPNYYFKEGLTWSTISSTAASFRYSPKGFVFETKGSVCFPKKPSNLIYLLGYLNSCLVENFLKVYSPTMDFHEGPIGKLPIIISETDFKDELVINSISIAKADWDSREISWDFKIFPLLHQFQTLKESYLSWINQVTLSYFELHKNEEMLNSIFIEIYELENELSPKVTLKDITILQDEMDRNTLEKLENVFLEKGKEAIELPIIKSEVFGQYISYSIGIYMGRYRLDKPGLNIAHPNPTQEELSAYIYNGSEIRIDDDGIISLMTRDCAFSDNGVNRVKELIEIIWGEATLTENMNFLEECLGTSLETYMYRDFWKDHCKRYKKTPIYWMFASKNAAFQVLVYMHRMNRYTVEKIRSIYLLPHIKFLSNQIAQMEHSEGSLSASEARRLDKFRKDLEDCTEYDLRLKDVADKQIEFDLDDGVKVNYRLFGDVVREVK